MSMPTYYDTGTVTVTASSVNVVGIGTLWANGTIMAGDELWLPSQPLIPPQQIMLDCTVNGEALLSVAWPGATATGVAYQIRFKGIIERSTAQTRRYLEALDQFSGVVALNPSAIVPEFADLAAYAIAANVNEYFIVVDDGEGRSVYYQLLDDSPVTWSDPVYITGNPGGSGIYVQMSDYITPLTVGTGKARARVVGDQVITGVRASLQVASTSGKVDVDILKNGVSIFSTRLTIDVSELTSLTASVPYVLSTTTLADDDQLRFDIVGAGSNAVELQACVVTRPAS